MNRRWVIAALFCASCGQDETVAESDVTGVKLTLIYSADLSLDEAEISATDNGAPYKNAGVDLPKRDPATGELRESIAILLPVELAGHEFAFNVLGRRDSQVQAEGNTAVTLIAKQLVLAEVRLAREGQEICGNGSIAGAEICDDGATRSGDGCSATCNVENGFTCNGAPSVCTPIADVRCGDGRIEGREGCDDGNTGSGDGCNAGCNVENGFTCSGSPSMCMPIPPDCGDGQIGGAEACDDSNTSNGDGCSANCAVENGFTCNGVPSVCMPIGTTCGDGNIEGAEGCDDDNTSAGDGCSATCAIEPEWVCSGEPSVCSRCGNGQLDNGETCDDGALNNETCWSRGYLNGTLSCNAACTEYEIGQCGPPIDSANRIQQAVTQAYRAAGGPDVISIHTGNHLANSEIVLDECVNGCAAGPTGVILRPLAGTVNLIGRGFRIRSGNNRIEGLAISNSATGILLEASRETSGNNVITNVLIANEGNNPPQTAIDIQSSDNQILSTMVANFSTALGDSGIRVNGGSSTVLAMNIIVGRFSSAIHLAQAESPVVDHNSIAVSIGTGLRIDFASDLCYRNNINGGSNGSTGMILGQVTLSQSCNISPTRNNAAIGHLSRCSGFECNSFCRNGPMCDQIGDPGWGQAPQAESFWLCLRPAANNPYLDQGVDLGYDHVDGAAATFNSASPDLGAREIGSTRVFGGVSMNCP